MASSKRKVTAKRNTVAKDARRIRLAVIWREQAPDEKHRFQAATDALLTELVRQQLGRGGKEHG